MQGNKLRNHCSKLKEYYILIIYIIINILFSYIISSHSTKQNNFNETTSSRGFPTSDKIFNWPWESPIRESATSRPSTFLASWSCEPHCGARESLFSLFPCFVRNNKKWLITLLGSPVAPCFPKASRASWASFRQQYGPPPSTVYLVQRNIGPWSSRPRWSSLERGESILPSALCPLLSEQAAKYCPDELSVDSSWPHLHRSGIQPLLPVTLFCFFAARTLQTCERRRDEILMTSRFL